MRADSFTFMQGGTLKLREVRAWFQNEDPAHDFRLDPELRCDMSEGNYSMRPDSNAMANDDANIRAGLLDKRQRDRERQIVFGNDLERNLATIAAMQRDVEQANEDFRIKEREARLAGTPLPNKRRERAMEIALERQQDGRTREGKIARQAAERPLPTILALPVWSEEEFNALLDAKESHQ